ncbi:RHS repeat-associated core domain-containing protein [Leifsonia sp. 2MCAF36]|uniref:RHS repeat-associated core domain-containing protein n=1 Tax=Leifsonia sp. 2MCAF36 TaxID=3232988 RepID=UPI003F94756C
MVADAVGAKVTFSGNEVAADLSVAVGEAPKDAAESAQAEQPGAGEPVSEPVQITAKDSSGKPHTQFPAKRTHTRGGGKKGPVVSDVIPGVALSVKPDLDKVRQRGLDAKSLKIYTREREGEPWVALPSYFNAKSGLVEGESTHLSQFVVIGTKFVPPPGPVIVLDPDDDEGRVSTPAPPVTELAYNIRMAQLVAGLLQQDCRAVVQITRQDPAMPYVSRSVRAGIAANQNPVATLGIGFNTLNGVAWGGSDPSTGGSQSYSRGSAADDALSDSLVGNLPVYTGRPAKNLGNNGNFPGPDFDGVPGALVHLEPLFMDNHYDRAVMDDAVGFQKTGEGILTGLGKWLETQGFDCTDPVTGGWPSPPSAADLARWRALGLQSYLTYGGEPFSFSTGNLVEQEKLFSLPGLGGSSTDLTLFYNSQDGRLSRVGAGWSFGLGARAQRFSDGSVMVVRGDGASFVFTADGNGGFVSDPTLHQTLSEQSGGRLVLTDVSGESWVFDAGDIEGIGELLLHTDANGNATSLTYGPADENSQQFVPLTSITAPGGQVIQVQSDSVGRVVGFTRPGGDTWRLSYDGAGDLSTVTLPDGRTHTFSYDGSHQLLTATDATGAQYLKNEYDSQGRIVKQWDAVGKLRSLDYSTPGQTTYTDTLGRKSVYHYDSAYRITKVQHADGTTATFSFDAQNNVTSSTDENKRTTAYTYDGSGNILTETSPSGSVAKYTYTPSGRLATKTDAGGAKGRPRTWAYAYDGSGRLTVTHQPDGTTVTNRYDSTGTLIASVRPSGATTTYQHDGAGNITVATDATGAKTRYSYDSAGRITAVTDPNGHTTSYGWDNGDRLVRITDPEGNVSAYGYEPNDHVSQVTDPTGAVTKYSWDALFHLTQAVNAIGGVTSFAFDSEDSVTGQTNPLGAQTAYVTDEQNRVVEVTDANGGVSKRTYDGVGHLTSATSPAGRTTTYEYGKTGELIRQVDPTGAVTRFGYDSVGRLVKLTDPDGVATRFSYDVMDRVTRVTDGLGKHKDYGYDVDGNLTAVTDRGTAVTTYTYDAAGRLTSTTSPLQETTAFSYDAAGNVVSRTDPLGRVSSATYTSTGHLRSITDPEGNTTTYDYDAAGRRIKVTDANGHTTAFAFDGDGRQTSTIDALGASTTYGYDPAGQQTSLMSPNGNETVYDYDPVGRLRRVIEGFKAAAAADPSTNVTTRYGYDKDGNRRQVTDPNGHTTTYEVDAAGRTTREVDPLGHASSTTYTPAGRIASTVTGTGATTAYRYDNRGDLIRRDAAGAIATFEYDPEQRLIAMTDSGGVTGFVYDAAGRVQTQIDQQGGRLKTGYDKAGQTTSITLPSGQQLAYTYDLAGKVTSQASPWGSLAYVWDAVGNLAEQSRSTGVTSTYQHDADDRITAISHSTPRSPSSPPTATPTPVPYAAGDAAAADCTSVAGYLGARASTKTDAPLCERTAPYLSGRNIPVPANPVPDGGALKYQYGYDGDGNVTAASRTMTDTPDALTTTGQAPTPTPKARVTKTAITYAYDALDRLSSSATSAGEKNAYGYDPAGNRVSWSRSGARDGDFTQQASFNDADQLTRSETSDRGRGVSAGIAIYGYDDAGDRTTQTISGTSTQFAYNPAGQTTQINRDGRTTAYGYDALGRNTTTTDTTGYGSTTTHTAFDGSSPAQTTAEAGTSTLVRDALGNLVEHVSQNGEATWDLLDRLGSTIAGAQGSSITQLSSYDDWGAQQFETPGWSAPENYTGEQTDPTQGLNHYAARAYDPAAAAWTTPDPWRGTADQPQSQNRYGYGWNNPTSNVDVDGNLCARVNPTSDALPTGCVGTPVQAHNAVTPPAPPQPQPPQDKPKNPPSPKATGPNSQSNVQDRHDDIDWALVANVFGIVSGVAGFLIWAPPPFGEIFIAIAGAAGLVSTAIACMQAGKTNKRSDWANCIVGALLTLIPFVPQAVKAWVRNWALDAVNGAMSALGIVGSGYSTAVSGGGLVSGNG